MKQGTKLISLILSTLMLLSVVISAPVTADAAVSRQTVSTGGTELKAENSVGAVLGDALQQDEQDEASSEGIADVTIEGKTATVYLMNSRKRTIVVGVYDETGTQLLQTAIEREVCPKKDTIALEFENDLPQYFYLRAFILDRNCAPIGKEFETNRYTKAYADFLAKTTADFPQDDVLNFDNDSTNNFAVYKSTVKEIATGEHNKPTVGDVYTFTDADESVRTLKTGDIFTFQNNGQPEIVKVGDISVRGDTVTVTPDKLEATEVFEYVKIDVTANKSAVETDEANSGEPETPEDSVGIDETFKIKHTFDIKKAMKEGGVEVSGVNGTLDLTANIHYRLYIGAGIFETELTQLIDGSLDIQVGVKINYEIKIPKLRFLTPIAGLIAFLKPVIEIEVSAAFHGKVDFSQQVGFAYSNKTGFKNLCKKPEHKEEFSFEGSIYVGFKFSPGVEALFGLVEANPSITVGLKNVGKRVITRTNNPNSSHLCRWCIDGDIFLEVGITAELKTGKIKSFELSLICKLLDWEMKIKDYYLSSNIGFGWGDCPNYETPSYCELCAVETNYNDDSLLPVGASQNVTYANEYYLIAVEDSYNGGLDGTIKALAQVRSDKNGKVEIPDNIKAGAGEYLNLYGACSHPSVHMNTESGKYFCDICGEELTNYHAHDLLTGDVNSDGKVDISDATALQKYLVRLTTLTGTEKKAADTNGDGITSISDATTIQKYVARLIEYLG